MPRYQMPDGEQLYVREIGQGEPVLVLSGLGMQSWQWLPFIFPNLKQFKFIIPDWRGFGGSKHCRIPEHLDAISSHWQDVNCLIEQLHLDQIIVIGYSMGATTSMHGMQYGQFGDKIKAYLHIDQTPKIPTDETWQYGLLGAKHAEFKTLLQQISALLNANKHHQTLKQLPKDQKQKLINLWLAFVKLQSADQSTPKSMQWAFKVPRLQDYAMPIQRLDYLSWYIDSYLYHAEDYRTAIAGLKSPATFFIGAQSTLYPAKGQLEIADSVLNSNKVMFNRSGHTPLISEPVKFSREIQRFLKQHH